MFILLDHLQLISSIYHNILVYEYKIDNNKNYL